MRTRLCVGRDGIVGNRAVGGRGGKKANEGRPLCRPSKGLSLQRGSLHVLMPARRNGRPAGQRANEVIDSRKGSQVSPCCVSRAIGDDQCTGDVRRATDRTGGDNKARLGAFDTRAEPGAERVPSSRAELSQVCASCYCHVSTRINACIVDKTETGFWVLLYCLLTRST